MQGHASAAGKQLGLSAQAGPRPVRAGAVQETAAPAAAPELSNEVREQQEVEGSGLFTAYQDGRVRVVFLDRTLLEMDGARDSCRLILPDGSRAVVAAHTPVGAELYVRAALEFAEWAFRTPAERSEILRAQAQIRVGNHAVLQKELSFLCTLCLLSMNAC